MGKDTREEGEPYIGPGDGPGGRYTDEEVVMLNVGELENNIRSMSQQMLASPGTNALYVQEVANALCRVAGEISPLSIQLGPWTIEKSPESQYLYIDHKDHPGDIHIKADVEGYVVDLWDNDKHSPAVTASLAVEYVLLEDYPDVRELQTTTPGEDVTPPKAPQFLLVEFPADTTENVESLAKDLAEMLDNSQSDATLHGPFDAKDNEKLKGFIDEE